MACCTAGDVQTKASQGCVGDSAATAISCRTAGGAMVWINPTAEAESKPVLRLNQRAQTNTADPEAKCHGGMANWCC